MDKILSLKKIIIETLDINKAKDIVSIDLKDKSSMADYMIIASGTSSRHIQALSEQVLKKLKETYQLGVLTNGNASIKTLGIDHLFDFYLNAEMVNDSKPGAKMFEEAMSITKLKANEICHVGDHPVNDIEGALNVGFKAIWLNALENSWPDGQKCHVPEVRNWKDLESTIAAF